MSYWIWLILAGVMAVAEAATQSLFTVWFVIGALVSFIAAYFGAAEWVQIVLFAALSLILMVVFRPYAIKHMRRGEEHEATPVGLNAVVIETIDNDSMTGRVETPDRMSWTAESETGEIISVGENVVVTGNRSIKLIVRRR